MVKTSKFIGFTTIFLALAMFIAGCGGGGGSTASNATGNGTTGLNVNLSLPREAFSEGVAYTATISVLSVSSTGAMTVVATGTAPLTYTYTQSTSTSTYVPPTSSYTGSFAIANVPKGNNYITKVVIGSASVAGRVAAQSTYNTYAGGLTDIQEGVWNSVVITPTTTIQAAAALQFALTRSTPIGLADLTAEQETAINTAVSAAASPNTPALLYSSNFLNRTTDPFTRANWSASFLSSLTTVLGSLATAPTISSYSPLTGATNVTSNGPAFKLVFNKSMTATDLNNQTTLSGSGFTLTVSENYNTNTLTITQSNALSYGAFSWSTTTNTNDTLNYTMKTTSQLLAAGLKILYPGKSYTVSGWSISTNILRDIVGNPMLSTSGIPTSVTFTTSTDATAPTVTAYKINDVAITPTSTVTNVPASGAVLKMVFSESMNTTSSTNVGSFTFTRSGGNSLTINNSNVQNYGTFSWGTTTNTNDTLIFTMKSTTELLAAGLQTLVPGTTYSVTVGSLPTALTDLVGNAVSTTGAPTSGSFTTATGDSARPTVSSFSPAAGGSVSASAAAFAVTFSEAMYPINLNTQANLTASGFSVTLASSSGTTLTINTANALANGSFAWSTDSRTLTFTISSTSTYKLHSGKTYTITARTVPTNLHDAAGNQLEVTSTIPSTGYFTAL